MTMLEAIAGLAGGAVDLGLGLYDRLYGDPKKREQKKKQIEKIKGNVESDYDKMVELLEGYREGQDRFVTPEMKQKYREMLSEYDPNAYIYDFDKFQFTDENGKPLSREDFVVENKDAMLADIESALSHSAAGAGLGRGSGAAGAIAQGVADKSLELQRLANQEYQQERANAYNEWSDYIDKMQAKMGLQEAGYRQQMGMIGGEMERERGEESDYMADLLSLLQGKSSEITQAKMAMLS
jgi:hypothetical protein